MIAPAVTAHRVGSALISTMLVLVVLTIIVVAFMQSMTTERQTARSYMGIARADLAAEAGVAEAISQIQNYFQRFPDSATAWSSVAGTEGTFWFYRAAANTQGTVGATPANIDAESFAIPLMSGGKPAPTANLTAASAFQAGLSSDRNTSVNLNASGGVFSGGGRPQLRAEWIELLADPEQPRDLSFAPGSRTPQNGPLARFAYWIEDESFRLNVNVASGDARAENAGSSPADLALPGPIEAAGSNADAAQIVSRRALLPTKGFLTSDQAAHAADLSREQFQSLSPYLTVHSGGLNLSRGGAKRLNLNDVITDPENPALAPVPADAARLEIERIVKAITNDRAMPEFGQRFFHFGAKPAALNGSSASNEQALIYVLKLAANIRDYIDIDSLPTILDRTSDFPLRPIGRPATAVGFSVVGNAVGDNDAAAIGKEAVPALQEYAFKVRLLEMSPPNNVNGGAGAAFRFEVDHYLEFHNPTTRSIALGNLGLNPFLRIYNQFDWSTGGGTDLEVLPVEIPLAEFVNAASGEPFLSIPPGDTVVFTTDANPAPPLCSDLSKVYRPSDSALTAIQPRRVFSGTTRLRKTFSESPLSPQNCYYVEPLLGISGGRGGTNSSDYDTHVVLGNEWGIVESFSALPVPFDVEIHAAVNNTINNQQFFVRGGSLRGNTGTPPPVDQTGDPRSLNEQLRIDRHISPGTATNQTRFYSSNLNNGNVPAQSTLGRFNDSFVRPGGWADNQGWSSNTDVMPRPSSLGTAIGVIANASMRSIGELGHIYDPSRLLAAPTADGVGLSRGGGRTLRIGQSDAYNGSPTQQQAGMWDGSPTSRSRNRAAWRLADVFSVQDDTVIEGLLNINGVPRDGGIAFRALVNGFRFTPESDLSSRTMSEQNESDLISEILARFPRAANPTSTAPDRPFLERGEISELPLFNRGNTLVSRAMETIHDRGKEELFRRIAEMITTKGNVFTIYCIGQALRVSNAPNPDDRIQVAAERKLKVTFEVRPVFDPALPPDASFDPVVQGGTNAGGRFAPPTRYEVKVLATSTFP